jgi:hypothetical protein
LIIESEKNLLTDDPEVIAEHDRDFLAMRRQEPVAPKLLCDQRRYTHWSFAARRQIYNAFARPGMLSGCFVLEFDLRQIFVRPHFVDL